MIIDIYGFIKEIFRKKNESIEYNQYIESNYVYDWTYISILNCQWILVKVARF